MEMLAGSKIPLVTVDTNTELVTPTGMGIIKTLSSGYGIMPAMKVEKVGYGMGKRETGSFNALRVVMGEMEDKKKDKGQVVILETNIDNMSSEILGYTMEKLFENGALDVFYTPIFMKKNRPAVLLSVLCSEEKSGIMSDIILKETTTLGIRKTWASRDCLDRSFAEVETGYGTVRVKIAEGKDFIKISPEFEDCAEIAKETGKPLREIFEIAIKKSGENDLKII